MAYLLRGDFDTHVYTEILNEIVRNDAASDEDSSSDIVTKGINVAISEVKSYLGRFDLLKLFGNDDTDAETEDENLKSKVKDVAVWQFIKLSNPNINLELARTNYKDAIQWLRDIQKGLITPDNWPLKADLSPLEASGNIGITSNRKRNNYF